MEGEAVQASARRTDPATSLEAARKLERVGKAHTQRMNCVRAVREHPGKTAYEIARILGCDGIIPGKRLPEARKLGFVKNGTPRVCEVRGSKAMTWWPGDRPEIKQEEMF